jgi:hypothetical protein
VLSQKLQLWFHIFVVYDVVNVMAAYQPVVRVYGTRWRRVGLHVKCPSFFQILPETGRTLRQNLFPTIKFHDKSAVL